MTTIDRCSACGILGPNDIDHIKTRGSGGTDDQDNCWVLCRSCHIKKHAIGLRRLIEMFPNCKDVLESKGWAFDSYKKKWMRK